MTKMLAVLFVTILCHLLSAVLASRNLASGDMVSAKRHFKSGGGFEDIFLSNKHFSHINKRESLQTDEIQISDEDDRWQGTCCTPPQVQPPRCYPCGTLSGARQQAVCCTPPNVHPKRCWGCGVPPRVEERQNICCDDRNCYPCSD